MADELNVLLERVDDPALRADLRAAVDRVRAKRSFGLVFESHLPERVRLPDHPVRRGVMVVGRDSDDRAVLVRRVTDGIATVIGPDNSLQDVRVSDVVVVAEFGHPIYPGLERIGSLERGGGKPAHIVINAENYHALEALQFTHAGRIDCIYIDPPYNTGARDWKYDNDYVDAEDAYRHSKWLAFMERRLQLVKHLLNPNDGVLIVAIDIHELFRLGLLIEQLFSGCDLQMVTSVINPRGRYRQGKFARSDEQLLIVSLGKAQVNPETDEDYSIGKGVEWRTLRRSDLESRRGTTKGGPNQFYPVYVNVEEHKIVGIGTPLAHDVSRHSHAMPAGCVSVFPVRDDGTEMNWGLTPKSFVERHKQGYIRLGKATPDKPQRYEVSYLTSGRIKDIRSNRAKVVGKDKSGAVMATYVKPRPKMPTTNWSRPSHNAEVGGTNLLKSLLGEKRFDYPKSLFAVEDILRYFVATKPKAVILDFFAGSGTTTHAVARLNRQDGGCRQSISITNNEVSAEDAATLRKEGFRPGDPSWEALGIYERVTRPRITAAVTGVTPEGEPITDNYRFVDEFPMSEGFAENVEFLKLTYVDPVNIELGLAFAAIAPLLWMRAGGVGPMIEECFDETGRRKPYALTDYYGVLFNPDNWRSFVQHVPESARTVFIVTDSSSTFAGVAEVLPERLEVVRLYENYLTTFVANGGR